MDLARHPRLPRIHACSSWGPKEGAWSFYSRATATLVRMVVCAACDVSLQYQPDPALDFHLYENHWKSCISRGSKTAKSRYFGLSTAYRWIAGSHSRMRTRCKARSEARRVEKLASLGQNVPREGSGSHDAALSPRGAPRTRFSCKALPMLRRAKKLHCSLPLIGRKWWGRVILLVTWPARVMAIQDGSWTWA